MAREIDNASIKPVSVEVTTPAFEAYNKFRDDFENTAGCALRSSMSDNSTGKIGTMTDAAVDKMAVVWLAEKYKELGHDVTREDITNGAASKLDTLMADRAMKQFDTIKHAKFDHEGGFLLLGSHEKDVLSGRDIDATLKGIENQRRSLDIVQPLLANNGELFDKLAKNHDGQVSINYWDLKDARRADDRARDKGDKIYSDDERRAIDTLYKKWGSSDMRRIEQRAQGGNDMGCDGLLTYNTMAKGAGFSSADELNVAANAKSEFFAKQAASKCETEHHNLDVLKEARNMTRADQAAIEENAHYAVQKGQGFDRIARHVLTTENGQTPNEQDVVQYSSQIAKLNGYDRNTYDPTVKSLQPGQRITVHDDQWKMSQHLMSDERIQDYLDKNLNNEALEETLRGR